MASCKPRERQFQVVAVPSTFTRGRWECRDFEDKHEVEKEILEFEKPESTSNDLVLTTTGVNLPDENVSTGAATFTVGETKESSTILVTSVVSSHAQKIAPTNSDDSPGTATPAETVKTISTNIVQYEVPPTTAQNNGQAGGQPVTTQFVQQTEIITTAKPEMLNNGQQNVSDFPAVDKIGVVTAISTQTQSITAIDPTDPDTITTSSGVSIIGANVVAIDNKIEQAMDLVKTHLTFAVREEVEILKNTIIELESKVALLENQNQILRQFAPPEVVANLPLLVQSNQQIRQQHAQQQAGVVSPPVSLATTQPQFPVNTTTTGVPIVSASATPSTTSIQHSTSFPQSVFATQPMVITLPSRQPTIVAPSSLSSTFIINPKVPSNNGTTQQPK
uniref:Uncharacterized protein n=1 Tax=Acrobeloides nanus TaxID=290746 RepID=A0A914ESI6_9BILA